MAAALPPQDCSVYHGVPISPAELQHECFCHPPPSRFIFDGMTFFKICGDQFYRSGDDRPFILRTDKFIRFASKQTNLQPPINAIAAMNAISQSGLIECDQLTKSDDFKMFCSDSVESKMRMKIFCAFGKLYCFLNKAKVKLIVRGGMALRMHLTNKEESKFVEMAPSADVDGVVIVDRTVDFEQFKTTFMKLLVSSIPPDVSLICTPATGDENTIKVKFKTEFGATYELIDVSFKHPDDPVVALYSTFQKYVQVYPNMLPCVWNFPSRQSLRKEYEYVLANLNQLLARMPSAGEPTPEQSKLRRDHHKFLQKYQMASTGTGLGGKKKRTMKRRMRMRGGSTTEQIGTAAQMRAFLPRNSMTRNALNHIVHHEDAQNKYYDPAYMHDHNAQKVINNAFRLINANSNISRRTKKKMMIAKKKSARAK
jgi:hypothetical protein